MSVGGSVGKYLDGPRVSPRQVVFQFFKVFRPALGPTHLPTRWEPGTHFAGSKWLVLEAGRSAHIVPRSGMSGGGPVLPPCTFMWCRGISATLGLLVIGPCFSVR